MYANHLNHLNNWILNNGHWRKIEDPLKLKDALLSGSNLERVGFGVYCQRKGINQAKSYSINLGNIAEVGSWAEQDWVKTDRKGSAAPCVSLFLCQLSE